MRAASRLRSLLAQAADADGVQRIDFRDPIAKFGAEAIVALEPWLNDKRLGTFAALTIRRAAEFGASSEARAALRRGSGKSTGRVSADIDAALDALRVRKPGRSAAVVTGSIDQGFAEVTRLVRKYRKSGSPPQPGIPWRREDWIRAFPRVGTFKRLPRLLDRSAVQAVAIHATESQEQAEAAFLVSRAWGDGLNGYAAWRGAKISDAAKGVGECALKVSQALAFRGALAAYGMLADGGECRMTGLGPAFATKFLYFAQTPTSRPRALILDRNLIDWFRAVAGLSLPAGWSISGYARYLETMHSWAAQLKSEPDELELCIFRSTLPPGNQWADR
jgi:hypothetical protein